MWNIPLSWLTPIINFFKTKEENLRLKKRNSELEEKSYLLEKKVSALEKCADDKSEPSKIDSNYGLGD